jgi:hypothetical protein
MLIERTSTEKTEALGDQCCLAMFVASDTCLYRTDTHLDNEGLRGVQDLIERDHLYERIEALARSSSIAKQTSGRNNVKESDSR